MMNVYVKYIYIYFILYIIYNIILLYIYIYIYVYIYYIYIYILVKDEHGRIRDQTTYVPTESLSGKICIALIYIIILQTFITIFIGSMLLPTIGTRFEINLATDWQFRCY